MIDQPGTLETLATELGVALSSLEGVLTPQNAAALFVELGLDAAPDLTGDAGFTQKLDNAAQRAGALVPAIDAISEARDGNNDLAAVQAVRDLLTAIAGLATALDEIAADLVRATPALPQAADLQAFALTFVGRLLGDAVVSYLETAHPFLRRVLSSLAIVEINTATITVGDATTTIARKKLRLDRVTRLLNDPLSVFHEAYGWGANGFDGKALFANARDVFDTLVPIATKHDADEDGPADLDLFGFLVRVAGDAAPPGLEGQIFADPTGQTDQTLAQFTEACRVALQIEGAMADGLALRLLPSAKLEVRAGSNIAGRVALIILGESADPNESFVLLGEGGGTRLQAAHVSAGLVADLAYDVAAEKSKTDFRFEAKCTQGELLIDPSGFDGLLASVLPSDGVRAKFEVGLVLSAGRGLTFNGTGGLEATFPVGLSLGAVTVPMVHMKLGASDSGLAAEVSASVGLSIGPVHALVDRVGMTTVVTFPKEGGNLAVVDLDCRFKPPSGIGLTIDDAGIVGGGFLDHDDAKQEYAGLLQLEFHSYKFTAFGLLATILPTGPGYSLIAMVDAEFPPIQLGFGFTLDGAGGLFGVHRIASVDGLRAALAANTLSNLLFPKNPIANAPQLLTELDTLFPAAPGRFVFGPIVRIEWGEAALLTLELALVLELPAPVRLVLIAEVTVLLPTPDEKLIEIHLSALGRADFGTSEGALDAVLHDSRLMGFTLHGGMALRVNWAGRKTFLLAVGGVHPKFQLPPGFPKLDRVGISMPSGNITTLNLDGYLAVTSNTLQIGAHVNIYVGVDDFGISGYLNFDTLIQRHPFHFDGDISGGIALSFEGDDIMALNLAGSLVGPAPWHAAGSVSFDFCWCTVTKSFSHTFGDSAEVPAVGQVDVGQLLRAALGDARNFAALFAPDISALVTLTTPVSAAAVVLAHPSTRLSVHQTVVPLGLAITQYGGSVPLGDTRFDITSVSVDGIAQTQPLTSVLDDFAPAQFLTLSDDDKLASPSFEQFVAGVEFDGTTIFGAPMTRAVDYETWLVDTPDGPMREESGVPAPLPLSVLAGVLVEGFASRGRFAGPHRVVMPRDLAFVVATSDQLTGSDVGASTGSSYSQARAALDAELALHPERNGSLLIAAHYEVAA
jgi:uncharacterized protein DUF6603